MIRIVMDAFGGDNAPNAVVEGAVLALSRYDDISITLCGREDAIRQELGKHSFDAGRMAVLDAQEVIDCHEAPTVAIKRKKDSSLVKALTAVAQGEADCIVSAGSTGALLTGATLIVRRIKGVKRPALAPLLPTRTGGHMMLIDCGANADCKPSYLQQFAVMGSAYMKGVLGLENPRVALLNNGAEAEKGNELTKAVYPRLSQMPLNFIGNVEARDIPHGVADVVVCDAFVGNAILKMMEGAATALTQLLKEELTANWMRKLCCLGLKNGFRSFKKKFDYTEYGGAPLLGLNGCVVKAHGSSNAHAIESAIRQAERFVDGKLVETLREQVVHFSDSVGE